MVIIFLEFKRGLTYEATNIGMSCSAYILFMCEKLSPDGERQSGAVSERR